MCNYCKSNIKLFLFSSSLSPAAFELQWVLLPLQQFQVVSVVDKPALERRQRWYIHTKKIVTFVNTLTQETQNPICICVVSVKLYVVYLATCSFVVNCPVLCAVPKFMQNYLTTNPGCLLLVHLHAKFILYIFGWIRWTARCMLLLELYLLNLPKLSGCLLWPFGYCVCRSVALSLPG